jgi:hypothetical protein
VDDSYSIVPHYHHPSSRRLTPGSSVFSLCFFKLKISNFTEYAGHRPWSAVQGMLRLLFFLNFPTMTAYQEKRKATGSRQAGMSGGGGLQQAGMTMSGKKETIFFQKVFNLFVSKK